MLPHLKYASAFSLCDLGSLEIDQVATEGLFLSREISSVRVARCRVRRAPSKMSIATAGHSSGRLVCCTEIRKIKRQLTNDNDSVLICEVHDLLRVGVVRGAEGIRAGPSTI